MKIIEITALENGAHRNQTGSFQTVPSGWAVIPETVPIPATFPFVLIELDGNTVTSMTAGVVPEPEPEPEPELTAEDVALDLMAEHEERICMLELNA